MKQTHDRIKLGNTLYERAELGPRSRGDVRVIREVFTSPAKQEKTRLKLTDRAKRILAIGAIGLASLGIVNAMPEHSTEEGKTEAQVTYMMKQGDTAWGIAERYAENPDEDDLRPIADAIHEQFNGTTPQPGVEIILPPELHEGRLAEIEAEQNNIQAAQ